MTTKQMPVLLLQSSNILLAADGTAKIADAGLAYVMCNQNHLSTSDMRGTYDWVSPECILSTSLALGMCDMVHCCRAALP